MRPRLEKKLAGSIAIGVVSLVQLGVMLALLPPRGAYPLAETERQCYLIWMSGASLLWLQTNLWLLWRGKFRWQSEAIVTSAIWLILLGIFAPTLVYAR